MAKDYAQRGGGRRSQTRQKGALPAWVWLVFGLSIGLAVAAFVYISRPAGSLPGWQAEKVDDGKDVKKTTSPKSGKGAIPLPPEEAERFTFYKKLKNQKIPVIPRDERPVANPKAPAAREELFLIQVASYKAVSDAENQKASLALLGIESRIEKVTVDDKDTYFRVRSGPMNLDKAQTVLARLQDNGLQGILVRAN